MISPRVPVNTVSPGGQWSVLTSLTFLLPALSLCSHSHTPCQVPRFSFPSDTGTVKLEPRKQAFT